MRIGSVSIPSPLVLAPMAGVTDLAFRTICRELGAGYTITEMVSAKALCYQDQKTLPLMRLGEDEHPAGVQIFGSDLACMEEGAAIVREVAHPDIIDINMAAPSPRSPTTGTAPACSGPGQSLPGGGGRSERSRRDPRHREKQPGLDKGNIVCLELAQCLEDLGIAAITLHGRTKVQMYAGTANWDWIRRVKQAPVHPRHRQRRRLLRPGCRAYPPLHRGRRGYDCPGCLRQPLDLPASPGRHRRAAIPPLPPLSQRCDTAVSQFELAAQYKSEKIACLEARKHYAWYLKGVPYAGYWKSEISKISTLADVYRVTAGIKRELKDASDDG